MPIRAKVAQPAGFVDPGKLRTLARRALLFDDVATALRTIAFSDSPYTIDTVFSADVIVLCNAAAGNIIVNLPSASIVDRRHYWIKKIEAGANTVTVTPPGAQTIDGGPTKVLLGNTLSTVHIVSNGVNWFVLAEISTSVSPPPAFFTVATRPAADASWAGRWIYLTDAKIMQTATETSPPGTYEWQDGPGGGAL